MLSRESIMRMKNKRLLILIIVVLLQTFWILKFRSQKDNTEDGKAKSSFKNSRFYKPIRVLKKRLGNHVVGKGPQPKMDDKVELMSDDVVVKSRAYQGNNMAINETEKRRFAVDDKGHAENPPPSILDEMYNEDSGYETDVVENENEKDRDDQDLTEVMMDEDYQGESKQVEKDSDYDDTRMKQNMAREGDPLDAGITAGEMLQVQELRQPDENSINGPQNVNMNPLQTEKVAGDGTECANFHVQHETVKEDFTWHLVDERNIYVLSAFYDDRSIVGGPLVRIVALGHQQKFHQEVLPLHCSLVFSGQKHAVSVFATYITIYNSELKPDGYTGHWIVCPVPERYLQQHGPPVSATVLPSQCTPVPRFILPVHVKKQRDEAPPKRLALCLPVFDIVDTTNWVQLVEWIIVHKLLGYSTIFAYITPEALLHAETHKILNLFTTSDKRGFNVVSIPWTLSRSIAYQSLSQHTAINDCLYRAGLDHDYVTVSDYNEVLMPVRYPSVTMPQFIDTIDARYTAAFVFQHVMFDPNRKDYLTEKTISSLIGLRLKSTDVQITQFQPWTMTRNWHMTRPVPSGKIRAKTVYKVQGTISADILYPKELVPSYTEKLVQPAEGVLYHYENFPPKIWLSEVEYVRGSSMDHFRKELAMSMFKVLQRIL